MKEKSTAWIYNDITFLKLSVQICGIMDTGLREIRFKLDQALALEQEDNFNTPEFSFLMDPVRESELTCFSAFWPRSSVVERLPWRLSS